MCASVMWGSRRIWMSRWLSPMGGVPGVEHVEYNRFARVQFSADRPALPRWSRGR